MSVTPQEEDPFVEELLEGVRLMVARARKHKPELEGRFSGPDRPNWWRIDEHQTATERFTSTIVIQCSELKALKPIAADLCNNIVYALDQLIGALTRASFHDNSNRLQFAWILDETKFERNLTRLTKYIGLDAADCIRRARAECRDALPEAHLAKEVSNLGKHWELIPSTASVQPS